MKAYDKEEIIEILSTFRRIPLPQQRLVVLLLSEYRDEPYLTSTPKITYEAGYARKTNSLVREALREIESKGWCKIEYKNERRYYIHVNVDKIINDLLNYPFTDI